MYPCFLCTNNYTSGIELCLHIKDYHGRSGRNSYICLRCNGRFNFLWRFKKHLHHCKVCIVNSENTYFRPPHIDNDVETYQQLSKSTALDFTCKLAGNMSIPRSHVFSVVDDVENLLSSQTEGMKTLLMPLVKDNKTQVFEKNISLSKATFKHINTEYKLDKALRKEKLMSYVRKIKFNDSNSEPESCDENEESQETNSNTDSKTLMPIGFQFKSFFESGNVFKKVKENTENIQRDGALSHYINGTSWKSKLKNFGKDDIVIPYHLHIDDTQTNNPLGTHRKNGDETCVYYSFPTLPHEYSSRLDNIFTALLFKASSFKTHGNLECYKDLVDALNTLADEGIILNVDGKAEKVYFVLGLTLGDNKGVSTCLGFSMGPSANYYCRHCRLNIIDLQRMNVEVEHELRNIQNYEEDLRINNFTATGIHEHSVFNRVRFFHCTDCGADLMHDVNEGIINYNIGEVLLYFIDNDYFTLDDLNAAKRNMKYGELESANKSGDIEMTHLINKKFQMTASEALSFVHHLTFALLIIMDEEKRENLENDEVWKFLLTTSRFIDMSYLPSYTEESIDNFRKVIALMNAEYMRLFNETLKPKHHYATHYPTLIKKYGPLRYISSIRYEANHRLIKQYTKNTASRRNLSYSIARKLQYQFAYLLKNSTGLKDKISFSKLKQTKICDEDFFRFISPSEQIDELSNQTVWVANRAKINGVTFSNNLCIPYVENNLLELYKINKVVLLHRDDISSIKLVCQKFCETSYDYITNSYCVANLQIEMELKTVSDVLQQRMFPIALQPVNGYSMFRYKYF